MVKLRPQRNLNLITSFPPLVIIITHSISQQLVCCISTLYYNVRLSLWQSNSQNSTFNTHADAFQENSPGKLIFSAVKHKIMNLASLKQAGERNS